jgi:hypothetical protein
MDYQFRPIEAWPGKPTPSYNQKRGPFRAGYRDTLDLLDRELRFLSAKQIVIQAYLQQRDIRNDGMIRADSRPSKPGVILSFVSKHGPLQYPCDRYSDWQDNLRGIAKSLEALRAVDRHGVTKRGEQYTGWTALPPPKRPTGLVASEQAMAFIEQLIGRRVRWYEPDQSTAIREAEKKTHPDHGGTAVMFDRVQQARRLILGSA